MRDGWSRIRRVVQFSYILAIGTLALAVVTLYSLVSPFNPMDISNLRTEPETVCPSQLVGVNGKTDLDSGRYHITIDPLWIELTGKNKVLDEAQIDGDINGPIDDQDTEDELVYVSPPEIGDWVIRFDIAIQGRNVILPRTQNLTVATKNQLHVVDCGDEYKYENYTKHKG